MWDMGVSETPGASGATSNAIDPSHVICEKYSLTTPLNVPSSSSFAQAISDMFPLPTPILEDQIPAMMAESKFEKY